jgi:hypothetical protein
VSLMNPKINSDIYLLSCNKGDIEKRDVPPSLVLVSGKADKSYPTVEGGD